MDDHRPDSVSECTFENFLVSDSNSYAAAASKAVSEMPGVKYNPLFIYGGAGLGKTHLLRAIEHQVHGIHKGKMVSYLTTEEFTNDFIQAIHAGKIAQFKERYRSLDVLLIDDIQFLIGKEKTHEEFFHTFNVLLSARRQIVISSDRLPKEMPTLSERLRSRFVSNLVAGITPPEIETREAILRMNAHDMGAHVPAEVISLIVQKMPSNIRELKAALINIIASASFQRKEITVELAREILITLLPEKRSPTPGVVQEAVAEYFGITLEDLLSKKRHKTIVYARHTAMFLTAELTDLNQMDIARAFGRDHSTLVHARDGINEKLDNPKTRDDMENHLENIRAMLRE